MAQPTQYPSVAQPPRLPLVVITGNRASSYNKDARLVNCYIETDDQGELWVYKRPGLDLWKTNDPGTALGAYQWAGNVYYIVNGTLFRDGVAVPTGTGLDTSGGSYRFSQTLGALPKLIFGNGNKTYTYSGPSVRITSVSTSNIGGTLPADAYYYKVTALTPFGEVMALNEMSVTTIGTTSSNTINWNPIATATGYKIYRGTAAGAESLYYSVGVVTTYVDTGSAGTAGTPPDFGTVSPDLHSIDVDFPVACVKGIVYLNGATYVMNSNGEIWGSVPNSVDVDGDWSAINFIAAQIEPDDGVYLAKQLVYVIAFGQWSTEVFFDAGNPTGSPLGPVQGSKISYGCASADSVQEIDDRLFWISSTKSAAIQVSMMDQLNHQVISTDPIDRLIQSSNLTQVQSLQLKINGHNFYILTLKDINITLAYDIKENLWHQWTDANGNYFPYAFYAYSADRHHVLQHESNGNLYYADTDYFNDDGAQIVVDIYTPVFDANTRRRKHLKIMTFIGDQETGSIIEARCSDDDYGTWTNFRKVDMSLKNPRLIDCGTFTKRAYHLRHRSNTKLRLQAVEVQYDIGSL
jgi:hypothetical protein